MNSRAWRAIGLTMGVLAIVACDGQGSDPGPAVSRSRTSAALRHFNSCVELEGALEQSLREEMRTQLLQYGEGCSAYRGGIDDGAAPGAEADASNSAGEGRQEGVDFSGTNNQEEGVDEADFVKTDGYHIYLLNGSRLEILAVPTFGELEQTATAELEGYAMSMLMGNDRITVFSSIYPYDLAADHPLRALVSTRDENGNEFFRTWSLTKITVLDIADRAAPTVIKELYIDGYFMTGREIDDTVRTVSYGWHYVPGLRYYPDLPDGYYNLPCDSEQAQVIMRRAVAEAIAYNDQIIDGLTLEDFVPSIYERQGDGTVAVHPFAAGQCTNFAAADDSLSRGLTSIVSLNLASNGVSFDADHIVSNWSTVYASTDTLLLAEAAWDWWWFWGMQEIEEATNIHRFDISTPGQTVYKGSGRVPGLLWDQFQLSEKDGYVRVATSTGWWTNWWWNDGEEAVPPTPDNHVFVLGGNQELELIGEVSGIGLGERIWSARFVGDKAYLVTFRSIDPLWTIDLSDPALPRVIGELEVPGVSTYIHPVANDRLLTIGMGGNEDGLDWGVTQISLFDVSDFGSPQRDAALNLSLPPADEGWTYSWSEASWEHKAFQYWAPKAKLAVPLATYRSFYDETTGYYEWDYFTTLQIVNVDVDNGALSRHGSVDHAQFYNSDPGCWWYWNDIRRSIFMGDFIYAISDRGVTAHRLDDLTLSAQVQLPGSYEPYCYDR